MFKKTLAAVAVLGAFAGSAFAANVTLYGVVDEALQYTYQNVQNQGKKNAYGMKTGAQAGNRWGLKGQEELGNGYVAGFVLESGFSGDDGKSAQGGRLFGRAASLYVSGGFGTLAAGHDGALASGVGTVSYIYQYAAMGSGWGDFAGAQGIYNFSFQGRADNALTYITPDLGGLKIYAQYSFQADGQEKPSANDNNRYGALGAQYKAGPFSTGFVVDVLKKAEIGDVDLDDQYTASLGASYDFEVAKVFALAQYGKHMDAVAKNFKDVEGNAGLLHGDLEGWNLGLGVSAPVAGGKVSAQVNYVDVKDKAADSDAKVNGYGVAAAYSYPLSKRTSVYTYGAWNQLQNKEDGDKIKTKVGEFGLGLTHKF